MATATHEKKPDVKKKAEKAAPVEKKPDFVELEAEYQKKYKDQNIVDGSLRSDTTGDHAGKFTLIIKCQKCDKPRRIATSDLHQCRHCADCVQEIRRERRRDARAEKPKKEKPPKAEKVKKEKKKKKTEVKVGKNGDTANPS